MIDISVIWQKIKLVFSFLKFPKWFYEKALFYYRCFKFKRLPKDKQEFLMEVYEKKYPHSTRFYNKNKILIQCLAINGFITMHYTETDEVMDCYGRHYWEEAYYTYELSHIYQDVIQFIWRKKHDKVFKTTKFDYNTEDEVPF
jgi:hypothetical protein